MTAYRPVWLHCERGKLRFKLLFPSGYDAVAFAEIREITGFRLTTTAQSGTQPKRHKRKGYRRINRVEGSAGGVAAARWASPFSSP